MPVRFHGVIALLTGAAFAQTAPSPALTANYDEAQAGTYTLPDPLVLINGQHVRDAGAWYKKRRPE